MEKQLADMPQVSVTHAGYEKRAPRRVFDIRGLPTKGRTWTHANDVANVVESVHERVLGRTSNGVWAPTLLPQGGAFRTPGMLSFQRGVSRQVGRHSLPWRTDQFVLHYGGQKRRRYESAARSLESKPVCRPDSYPSVFLKAEKWHEPKAGRLISARSPRYNLEVGRYLLPLEPRVYKAIDGVWGAPTIMKGYTPERRAEVAKNHAAHFGEMQWVAYGADFSKFDQHQSKDSLAFEHAVYLAAYNGDRTLQQLLSWQLQTTCYADAIDGKVRYTVQGGRMSGDMNTAMGNCLVSAGLFHAYCSEKGIEARAMVDGDDALIFMRRCDAKHFEHGISAWMQARGFILTLEDPAYELHELEFCQCRYVGLEPPTMVRNPYKAITQDHTWIEDRSITWKEVLAATGLGGLALYGNVPVLGAYYDMLARCTQPSKKTLARLDFRSSWLRDATFNGVYAEPSEDARYEFWRTWGMSPGEQRAIEADFLGTHLEDLIRRDVHITAHLEFPTSPYEKVYYAV